MRPALAREADRGRGPSRPPAPDPLVNYI